MRPNISINQGSKHIRKNHVLLALLYPPPLSATESISNVRSLRQRPIDCADDFCRFVISFLLLTYFLNRPCIYCSALLLILFVSSCYWSDQCIFDFRGDLFSPRHFTSPLPNPLPSANWSGLHESGYAGEGSFLMTAINETASVLASAAVEEMKRRMIPRPEWTGVGLGWIRSWLGGREFRLPCLDVYVRL